MSTPLYECCDCGARFEEPDRDRDPDNDCCPECGFDEIREVDETETIAVCPECGGYAAADNTDPEWRCIHHNGVFLGCGWTGKDPDYRERTEEDEDE